MKCYVTEFEKRVDAYFHMLDLNRNKNRKEDFYCLVDGPEDNFAVVDIDTALELETSFLRSL